MASKPPLPIYRYQIPNIWSNYLSRCIHKTHISLLKEFYTNTHGNMVAATSGAEIFLGIVRRIIFEEKQLDLGLSKFKVRETLKEEPVIAEQIIDKALEAAKKFKVDYSFSINWIKTVRSSKEYTKSLLNKIYQQAQPHRRIGFFI